METSVRFMSVGLPDGAVQIWDTQLNVEVCTFPHYEAHPNYNHKMASRCLECLNGR